MNYDRNTSPGWQAHVVRCVEKRKAKDDAVWQFAHARGIAGATYEEMCADTGIDHWTMRGHVQALQARGKLRRVGEVVDGLLVKRYYATDEGYSAARARIDARERARSHQKNAAARAANALKMSAKPPKAPKAPKPQKPVAVKVAKPPKPSPKPAPKEAQRIKLKQKPTPTQARMVKAEIPADFPITRIPTPPARFASAAEFAQYARAVQALRAAA